MHGLVERIQPFDDVEAEHREAALQWLESTDDVFRRVKQVVDGDGDSSDPCGPGRPALSEIPHEDRLLNDIR